MAAPSYPTPHPFEVAGYNDAADWRKADRPIAPREDFEARIIDAGRQPDPAEYDEWRTKVEAVMAPRAKRTPKAEAPVERAAPVQRDEIPAAPANAVPMLRHLQQARAKPQLEAMNVRIPADVAARLDAYLIRHRGVNKQVAVADMLDFALASHGFPPAAG